MGLSFRKKLSLNHRILATVDETLALQMQYKELIDKLVKQSNDLSVCTQKLLDLSNELLADSKTSDELEVTEGGILQIVTSHGSFVVGSECPEHKRVHNSHGWYICIDGGIVDATGWYPNLKH